MPTWLWTLLTLAIVAAVSLLLGWSFSRGGRRRWKRASAMGSMLLGFGMVFDPPARHTVEASERRVAKGDENGDPPEPEIDGPEA